MEGSRALSALVGAAIGFGAGYALWGPRSAQFALDRQVARLEAVSQQLSRLPVEQQLAATSRASHSALPAPSAEDTGAPASAQHPTEAAISDSKSALAIARSRRMIEEALRAHRWTAEDSSSLRRLIAELNVQQQLAVVTSVARAINAGQLEWNGRGPPF